MSRLTSPFSSRLPAPLASRFIGRGKEVTQLLIGLKAILPKSYGIAAGPKMGKTSLLMHVANAFREEWPGVLLYVFMDANELPSLSAQTALQTLKNKLIVEGQKYLDGIGQQEMWEQMGRQGLNETNQVKTLLTMFAERLSRLSIICAIDNLDRLMTMEDFDLFSRNLANIVGYSKEPVAVILAGTYAAIEVVQEKTSPLATLLDHIYLACLTPDETVLLIQTLADEKVSEAVVSSILNKTGGHPFLVQYIMEQLFDRLNGKLTQATPEIVEAIAEDFLRQRPEGRMLFKRLTDLEHQIYYHFVHTKEKWHKDELFLMGLKETGASEVAYPGEIEGALKALATDGLIVELPPDHYVLAGKLYADYFARHIEVHKEY